MSEVTSRSQVENRLANAYTARRILVTGGASFIGSHLCELLVKSGGKVTVADDLSSGRRENLSAIASCITFLKGDLRRPELAAAAAVEQEVSYFRQRRDSGVRKIVHASSACTYPTNLQADESSRLLLKESDANLMSRVRPSLMANMAGQS